MSVNTLDFMALKLYHAEREVTVNEAALDIDGDGVLTGTDLIYLMKYLAGDSSITIY